MAGPNVNTPTGKSFQPSFYPVATYACSSYQINSGTAIAAGASVTETITFTGLATTDTRVAIAAREGAGESMINGLTLASFKVTATNTVTATWRNDTDASITPGSATTALYAFVLRAATFS